MVNYSRISCAILLILASVLILKVVFVDSAEKEIPMSKVSFAANNVGARLKFSYCYSCGYRKAFEEYSSIVKTKYPDIDIYGGNYDPPGISMFLAKVFGLGKILVILCVMFAINPFSLLGQAQPPAAWIWCQNNKIYACMMIFFITNVLESQLVSTGAFEISLNDIPVWSKLETGRMPMPPELFQIIDTHLQFKDTVEYKDSFPK